MSYLNALLTDLRDKKLWPLAVALLAALVAVPVLLTNSPSTPPAQPLPSTGAPVASNTGAAVTVDATPVEGTMNGKGRDPFTQQPQPKAKTTTSTTTTSAPTTGTSTSSSGIPVVGGTTTPPVTGVPPVLPVTPTPATHAPAPKLFTADDAYHVSLAITDGSGGVNAIDPLTRDSELPSNSQPLLVELGVLQGGKRVIFSVQPGAVVGGPGACIPGPVDCEVLSLGVGQTEAVRHAGSGATTLFQVTGISVDRFGTAAQAARARAHVDAAGRDLLASSTSSTLALFQYDPSLGAVVDLRNLTVGGN